MLDNNHEIVNSRRQHTLISVIAFLLAALEGFFCCGLLISGRLRETNGTLTLLSSMWLLAILAILLVSLALIVLAVLIFRRSALALEFLSKAELFFHGKSKLSRWIIPFFCLLYLIILFVLNNLVKSITPLINEIMGPVTIWFYALILESLVVFVLLRAGSDRKKLIKPFFNTLGFFVFTWIFVATTGIGIIPDDRYWNVAGVPVLAKQAAQILIIAVLADSMGDLIQQRVGKVARWIIVLFDNAICIALWVGAASTWIKAPFGNSFFAEGPALPNNDFYPYSDAALMDLGGQYMLIGEGLDYPFFTEKTLYIFFLGILHLFAGQNYLTTTSWQIVIFAVFPVLMYLFGRKFSGRLLGVSLALFSLLKEADSISATFKISVSNSRLYLTEFPTAIAMLALGITLFMWFRNPERKTAWIILSGGIIGFAIMIRTNPLFLIPVIFLFALLVYRFQWKKYLTSLLIFMAGLCLAIGPWIVYDQISYGTDPYTSKIAAVVQTRFLHGEVPNAPTGVGVYDEFLFNFRQQLPVPSPVPSGTESSEMNIVVGHFLNNEIKALFILPFQLYPQDYSALLGEPYWKEPVIWKGSLPFSVGVAFALNLSLISLGIAFAWKKWHLSGLVPLVLNIGYYLANALGRTSGSRYLLPVDWTLYFYFLMGIVSLILWLKKPVLDSDHVEEQNLSTSNRRGVGKWILISGAVILLAGLSIPVVNASFPQLYKKVDQGELISQLTSDAGSSITTTQAAAILQQQNGVILRGRMLYPRFEPMDSTGQDGLYLTVLTPELEEAFIPMKSPYSRQLPAGSDVIVIGCRKEGYIEGYLGYVPDGQIVLKSNLQWSADICR